MKTKTLIKVLSLALCLLMLVSALAACQKPAENPEETTPAPSGNQGTVWETDENGYVKDMIPDDVDYGNAQVKALIWKENKGQLFPDEETGATKTIKTDIYNRNKEIEADLGVKFDPTFKESNMGGGENQAELYQAVLNGTDDWDIVCCYSLYPTQMMQEGLLYDLNSMEFPMTEMPWYSEDIQNWAIHDRLFYLANNSSIRNIQASWVVYVNNTMLKSKNVADIEETVINMEWTLAKMKEISRKWQSDAEANSEDLKDANNVYGLGISHRTAGQAFYHAAGFQTYTVDATSGRHVQAYFEASHIKLVSDFCDQLVDLVKSKEVAIGPYSSSEGDPQFGLKNHNAALFVSALDQVGYIKERTDYSIIPLPMKDATQTRYYTIQNYAYDVWCIPTSSQDAKMCGIILEAISSDDYRNIAPKWWEDDFKYRYANSDNGVKIFDLIRSSLVADFGRVTNGGSPYNALSAVLMPSKANTTPTNNYAVDVGSGKATQQQALTNLYNTVERLLGIDAGAQQE